jgi:hypothetical protein
MRVIYTSKGMSKKLGRALYIRSALSIEKYVIKIFEIWSLIFSYFFSTPFYIRAEREVESDNIMKYTLGQRAVMK